MNPLRLAQLSDFHWTHLTCNPIELCSKRLAGRVNWWLHRKASFASAQVDALPSLFAELGVERVLLGGDFTSNALPQEYSQARNFVDALERPWIAIPGNHDHYTLTSYFRKRFYRYLSNEIGVGPFRLQDHGIEAHLLAPSWWLVALDTARPSLTSRGRFSSALEARLQKLLASIPSNDSILLFNHYPFFQNDLPSRGLVRGEALEALCRSDTRIRAYLHGHTHRHIIADLQRSGYPVILDGGCVGFARGATWNLLTLDNHGICIDVYRWRPSSWFVERTERIAWMR